MDNVRDLQPAEDPVFPWCTVNIAVGSPFADSLLEQAPKQEQVAWANFVLTQVCLCAPDLAKRPEIEIRIAMT
jgi:hypothetical protein